MRARLAEALGLDPNGVASLLMSQPAALAIGFALSLWLVLRRASSAGFDRRAAAELLIAAYLGALAGGRLLDVLTWGSAFWREPWRLFDAWFGGASTLGGLIGAGVAVALWARRLRIDGVAFLDTIAPVAGITVACFKLSCLLAGCCFGARSGSLLAVRFPASSQVYYQQVAAGLIDTHYHSSLPVHPVQAYEAVWALLVTLVLLLLERRLRAWPGARFALGAALLLIGRLAVETWRQPIGVHLLGLSGSQVACVIGLVGLLGLALHRRSRCWLIAWLQPRGR